MKSLSAFDPTVIASYRLLGVLGNGGMGRVYLGQSPSGRQVAIKVVRADLVDDPATRRRFAREVAAVRTISPLFTAAVVDADTDAESPWLATMYIDGPSLELWVAQHGALAPTAVLTLAAGLAEAVGSIHDAGLVHRDIKPSNVLLSGTGPYVIDFGLVLSPHSTRISMGRPVGTPSYMAPECIRGEEAGPAADIFAIGATLVYAATGRSLVEGEAVYAQIMQITQGRFHLSEIPAELRPLISRCLRVHPEDRPTAAELVAILTSDVVPAPKPGWYETAQAAPLGVVLDVPTRTGRLSRRRMLAYGGASLVVLGVGGWFASHDRNADRPASVGTSPPPGTVLWQAASGADPTAGGSAATRIIPDGQGRIVAARPTQVYAQTAAGRRLWNHPLPAAFVDAHAWQGAVLVADTTRLWLLDRASGHQRFAVDIADSLKAKGAIGHVVSFGERAFVNTPTAIVALDGQGRLIWHQAASSPLAADTTSLLTYDRSGFTVRVGLRDAATGRQRWVTRYRAPGRPPIGPPPVWGPADGPPGGPPLPDDAWMRTEAHFAAEYVAVRDGQDLRVLRLRDGGTVWTRTWPTPIAAIAVAADLLLVGADRLTALTLGTGAQVWQSPLRGARMAVSADGQTIAVAAERTITVLDRAGSPQWQTDLPATVAAAVPDRVTLDQHTMFVTFKPLDQHADSLDVDVVAVALRDP